MNKKESKADELLIRVFKIIAESHFKDHKMSPRYCNDISFRDRSLGDDISQWIENYHYGYYKLKEKQSHGEDNGSN